MNIILRWLAVIALVIAALIFAGAIRDGQWYNLAFAVVTLAVALWWASTLVDTIPRRRREP